MAVCCTGVLPYSVAAAAVAVAADDACWEATKHCVNVRAHDAHARAHSSQITRVHYKRLQTGSWQQQSIRALPSVCDKTSS